MAAQVAILCNHQRAVPTGHTGQMQKMEAKLLQHQEQLDALQAELVASQKGKKYEGNKPRAADMCAPSLSLPAVTLGVQYKIACGSLPASEAWQACGVSA